MYVRRHRVPRLLQRSPYYGTYRSRHRIPTVPRNNTFLLTTTAGVIIGLGMTVWVVGVITLFINNTPVIWHG